MYLNTTPQEDTFCEKEYAALCEEVAASLLHPAALLPTVQTAVTTARMTRRENWLAEGRRFLQVHGLVPDAAPAPMYATATR